MSETVKIYVVSEPRVGERVRGMVYGHPNFAEGAMVLTTPVQLRDGTFFQTASGTQYEVMNA